MLKKFLYERRMKYMKIITEKIKENLNTIIEYFLLFILYSNLGWWLEVLIFYCQTGEFINRGFLIGPYCSIYGFGCMFITIFFGKYKDRPIKLFVLSVIWSSIIEYTIGYIMEIIFGGRWWHYTDASNLFNLNGRVWIVTSLMFGILATLLITKLEPLLLKLIRKIPKKFINSVATIIITIYVIDIVFTSSIVVGAREIVENIGNDCTTIISGHVWDGIEKIFK